LLETIDLFVSIAHSVFPHSPTKISLLSQTFFVVSNTIYQLFLLAGISTVSL
jgi:hypothetical protein